MPTTQEKITEAEAALHSLVLGKQAVEVRDSNGETVRFTQANVTRLRAYIAELRATLAAETGGTTVHKGPMVVKFGAY